MPESDVAVERPWPRFVAIFSPWRWFGQMRPWKRWVLLTVVVVAGYIESPMLLTPMLTYHPVATHLHPIFEVIWYPLQCAYDTSPAVHAFYNFQADILEDLFLWRESD